ncbi:HAMP domain-containing histidine kinase [Desulfobotulus sp. H1]|uniref:histidine kinase n=1 Tax=Desulfobotulus pelophilus TaxID=2823377 RepID=A0ABT3N6Y9_9BACT|nr:HAMP domain-containing sensor histidine kinase [Desulfobotulus pelophilus]MCW7753210.1 HAMP domain-containing histidine kinase [Desulfobotulus pelophilus]
MKPSLLSRPPGLRTTLLLYILIPLTLALVTFGTFALTSIEGKVEQQMKKDLELVARAIQLPLSYALQRDSIPRMQQALESALAIGRIYSAYVYDQQGKEILRLGLADPEPKTDRLSELAADGENLGEYGRIAGHHVYSYFVPLTDQGGHILGLLHLTRRGSEFNQHTQSIRLRGILFLGTLLAVLSTLVLFGHHRALGRHLARLTASMATIAEGKRSHRFQETGPMEILRLGIHFNHMLNSIQSAEKALREQQEKQEELEKKLRHSEKLAALGRLAAGTAHELGSPLSVINGKAQRALRDKNISGTQRQALASIREQVSRMDAIIRQLLNFSRRNPLRCSPADPARLAATAAAALSEEASCRRSDVLLTGPTNSRPLRMDTMRVQQALINLLRNAIQCAPCGKVHFSWQYTSSGILFSVCDEGPGIAPEIQSKIFEPFFTTKPVGQGTGLGLSVVHTVAEEHGGFVEIAANRKKGSCFHLFIPEQKAEGEGKP